MIAHDHKLSLSTIGIVDGDNVIDKLDPDGLPPVGALMSEGDPLYRYY